MKRSKLRPLLLALLGVLIAAVFFLLGYQSAAARLKKTDSGTETFYATISDMRDERLTVTGMEVNDINFRGEFTFSVTEDTQLIWHYTEISLSDLAVGDAVAVTFDGGVEETYPAQISVVKLTLLEDTL